MKQVEIIAEVGQAHEGSLGIAHSYIDALSQVGVDIVKFQTHISEAESSSEEPFRINFSYEDKTRSDYWKRMEFSLDQWSGLKKHCEEVGVEFMSTPSCLAAVDLLEKINVSRYKIGSGDLSNRLLLKKVIQTNKPIIISTGMSSLDEITKTVMYLKKEKVNFCLMHCTSNYPTKPEDIRLSCINDYRNEFNCSLGFSDHSGTIYPLLGAATLQVDIIEFHSVFDKKIFGPDSSSSLNMNEAKALVKGVRFMEKCYDNKNDIELKNNLKSIKNIFEKTLAVNKSLNKGHKITFDDLESKKPANMGIPASEFESIIGRRLKKNKNQWSFLTNKDLE